MELWGAGGGGGFSGDSDRIDTWGGPGGYWNQSNGLQAYIHVQFSHMYQILEQVKGFSYRYGKSYEIQLSN